ncbi:MAG: patatin-like phospholipase family protein [Proteobacteria bacterium]|nr:patatin-like phospholipase family protein [Pseudomonadota bacterium]
MAVSDSLEVPTPDPLHEQPPADRYCDLILNGGVASGVVYPWALLELARHYRFRRIGGNSVGAMAAALAAAAEYGRCNGNEQAFEPLRQAPLQLAEEKCGHGEKRSGMLRLFQPGAGLEAWFEFGLLVLRAIYEEPRWKALFGSPARALRVLGLLFIAAVPLLLVLATIAHAFREASAAWLPWSLGVLTAVALWAICAALQRSLRALAANGWGLCTGRSSGSEAALIEWLHRGIQLSAGRGEHDPPLTFADLWHARPGAEPPEQGERPLEPAIDLEMFSTLVSLGRPLRLPLLDGSPRLFYRPGEWADYFHEALMRAVVPVSRPYAPASDSDPPVDKGSDAQQALKRELLEVPVGDLPIAIAARMSLSYPLLFSCVPVYAIDYEIDDADRRELHRVWMTDGGLCTNFPIHLFDAALPRWPTFALMLSRRLKNFKRQSVWLPEMHLEGRADNWDRGVPGAVQGGKQAGLLGLLLGMVMTGLNWNDALTSRLPQVRNRVLRMALRDNEGQLNLAMPGERILRMANEYGTGGGKLLVRRFGRGDGPPRRAWREHLYVRALTELRGLRAHLRGFALAATSSGHSVPLAELLRRATRCRPLRERHNRPDRCGDSLTPAQADALLQATAAVAALEQELARLEREFGPYRPAPVPELTLRAPL